MTTSGNERMYISLILFVPYTYIRFCMCAIDLVSYWLAFEFVSYLIEWKFCRSVSKLSFQITVAKNNFIVENVFSLLPQNDFQNDVFRVINGSIWLWVQLIKHENLVTTLKNENKKENFVFFISAAFLAFFTFKQNFSNWAQFDWKIISLLSLYSWTNQHEIIDIQKHYSFDEKIESFIIFLWFVTQTLKRKNLCLVCFKSWKTQNFANIGHMKFKKKLKLTSWRKDNTWHSSWL